MDISTNLFINKEDIKDLANIIGCDQKDLPAALSPFASAAIKELATMILGQKVFNRGSDIIEYRLFLLIQTVFDNKIPDEADVCKFFQTTTTASRSLIRAVMSKYQYELKTAIEKTLIALLENVELLDDGHTYFVSVHNLNLVDELNNELAEIDTNLPPVKKKRGSVSAYELKPSSYTRLCEQFGVELETEDEEEETDE